MKILYIVATGASDATRGSIPFHLAVNGSVAVGDETSILLAGDGAEWVNNDALSSAEGVGVPPMSELIAKVRQHDVPVFV